MSRSHLPRVVAACTALLLTVQAVWTVADPHAAEGPILIVFTKDHGLTTGDLLGVVLGLLAFGLWFFVVFAPNDPHTTPATHRDRREPILVGQRSPSTSVPFSDPPRTLLG